MANSEHSWYNGSNIGLQLVSLRSALWDRFGLPLLALYSRMLFLRKPFMNRFSPSLFFKKEWQTKPAYMPSRWTNPY